MRRINTANTIDLSPGKKGFRGKNTAAGVPGTPLHEDWLNDLQEEVCGVVEGASLALAAARDQLARAIRSNALNTVSPARVGGTANAVTLTFPAMPFVALADLVLVPLRFVAEANTTAQPSINVDGLGAVPSLGSPWRTGDIIQAMYDGVNFRHFVVGPAMTPAAFVMTTNAAQSIPASTVTVVGNFTTTINDTVDSTLSANKVTIGPRDAGWYALGGKLMYDFPASGQMYCNVLLERNTVEIGAGNAVGTGSIRARPQAISLYKVSAGDEIRLTTASDITRSLTSGGSLFFGFKVGA